MAQKGTRGAIAPAYIIGEESLLLREYLPDGEVQEGVSGLDNPVFFLPEIYFKKPKGTPANSVGLKKTRRKVRKAIPDGGRSALIPSIHVPIDFETLGLAREGKYSTQEMVACPKGIGSKNLSEPEKHALAELLGVQMSEVQRGFSLREHSFGRPEGGDTEGFCSRSQEKQAFLADYNRKLWKGKRPRRGIKFAPEAYFGKLPERVQEIAKKTTRGEYTVPAELYQQVRLFPSNLRAYKKVPQGLVERETLIRDLVSLAELVPNTISKEGGDYTLTILGDGLVLKERAKYAKTASLQKDLVVAPTGLYFVDLESVHHIDGPTLPTSVAKPMIDFYRDVFKTAKNLVGEEGLTEVISRLNFSPGIQAAKTGESSFYVEIDPADCPRYKGGTSAGGAFTLRFDLYKAVE